MKLLLLASFALICTASTVYRNKNITVEDDGSILINTPTGKRVAITREVGLNGQRNIDIAVSGPNIPTKRIQIDDSVQEYQPNLWAGEETRLKRGSSKSKSQGDVLSEILKEFQGGVTGAQYEKLLAKISVAVKQGEVSPQVYDLLQGLDQQQGVWAQNQGLYGLYGRYGGVNGYLQGQYTPYVNPLLSSGLLGNQYGIWGILGGYQYPQGSSWSRVLSGYPLLRQPIQTIQQTEQTIQQLEAVQQQLQQNIENIEQLGQIQQQRGVSGVEEAIQQEQLAQLSGVQQVVQQLEQQQVGQLVQQLQQQQVLPQQVVPQFQGQQYGGVQGQLAGLQGLPLGQQLQGQQYVGVQGQLAGVQGLPLQGQYGIQQLTPIQQQQLYSQIQQQQLTPIQQQQLLNQIQQQQLLRQVGGISQQQPIWSQRLSSLPPTLQQLVPQVGQSRIASSRPTVSRSFQGLNTVPQVVF